MSETPARYGLPTECPSSDSCPGCPRNAARAHCRPPAFFQSGTQEEVLTAAIDVLTFMNQALHALGTFSTQAMDDQTARGVSYIMTDVKHALDSCGAQCGKEL